MPNRDGTGPNGKGPMTGRGSGNCVIPLITDEEEINYLKNQKKALRDQLKCLATRIKALETTVSRSEE